MVVPDDAPYPSFQVFGHAGMTVGWEGLVFSAFLEPRCGEDRSRRVLPALLPIQDLRLWLRTLWIEIWIDIKYW